jgi:hypothetical protein
MRSSTLRGRTEAGRLRHDVARQGDADEIADHREKPDQRVDANSEARTGDRDRAVEQPGEVLQVLARLLCALGAYALDPAGRIDVDDACHLMSRTQESDLGGCESVG